MHCFQFMRQQEFIEQFDRQTVRTRAPPMSLFAADAASDEGLG